MIVYLVDYLRDFGEQLDTFRVFRYITVRSAVALIVAFGLSLLAGPAVIRKLRELKVGQQVRKITLEGAPDLYDMHQGKQGTPTMGGVLILLSLMVPVVLFCRLGQFHVLALIGVTLALGGVGFADDYLKVKRKNHKGLSARAKLLAQAGVGLALGACLYLRSSTVFYGVTREITDTSLCVPFFKNVYPELGIFYIFFAMLVITATSNAVNLTDGLDGLAIGIAIIAALAYVVITYLAGNSRLSAYLLIPYVPGAGEVTVFLAAMVGAGMGFLWFNAHPAEVFMGDTGSLAIGGALGAAALLCKHELLLLIVGGIFVIEALSVILQVLFFRCWGKRLFLMSPLHHHFEKKGIAESKIIVRFWIMASLLVLLGLATLKLR